MKFLLENTCLMQNRFYHYTQYMQFVLYPFPKRQILDSSKLKDFADNYCKFYENFRNLTKRVENTVGKEEISRYKQFLLFPQCFQKTCTADA